MLIQFFRFVDTSNDPAKPDKVQAKMSISHNGKVSEVAILQFPDKMTWSTFYGALSSGALNIRELEVRMENATEGFKAPMQPPTQPPQVKLPGAK